MELPPETWISEVSMQFPETTFRLLTGILLEDGALELGELTGDEVQEAATAINEHRSIGSYEPLHSGSDRSLARYETDDTALYEFLQSTSFPPEFPMEVRNGTLTFDLTGSRQRLREAQMLLEASSLAVELVSITDAQVSTDVLTERQREAVEVALDLGYYEVPRATSLAAVADALDVDQSSASGLLRRAEGRIVRWFTSIEDRRFER